MQKVEAELRLCEDQNKAPRELLQECVYELEEKGFLNCQEHQADKQLYEVRDQRDKLKHFITQELKTSQRGLSFDNIHKRVSAAFQNFYTKDFVFKIIEVIPVFFCEPQVPKLYLGSSCSLEDQVKKSKCYLFY